VKYVSLHHHSTYSYMDGFGTPEAHVLRAADLGMGALALTEHGNVSSHVQLEKAATKAGIQPIFGLEAYTALDAKSQRKFHLTLLAMDATGYANLMRIVSRSWAEGFYYWPTVSGRMLADHHEGLIVLSGCADSLVACSLLGGKTIDPADASYTRALRTAQRFRDLLGDRFYLEVQMFPELARACTINPAYESLGNQLDIPLVATADVHYPQPNDNEMQVILHAAGRGAGSVAAQEAGWEYDIRLTHPLTDRLAFDRLLATGLSRSATVSALQATASIADRCKVVLPKADRLRYPLPANTTAVELVWRWLRDGWSYRVRHGNRQLLRYKGEYTARLNMEMDLIRSKDFIDYFLMVSDIVRFAKDRGISVGPGRGSAASSLVCYLLRITEVDPMQFPLMMFSRFIDPTRSDLPDIDVDFDDSRRWEVREYAVQKYGEARVGNIANYVKYKGKNALQDVQRVFPKIPKSEVEVVKNMIVERSGGDSRADAALADTVEMFPTAKAVFDKYPDLWKATRLEGNYRGMSVHAAGLVIGNRPIAEVCAMYSKTKKVGSREQTITVVSVDKKDAEYLGLMKMDILGLSTMGMIGEALGMAGLTLEDLYNIPLDDPETTEAFRRNDVVGIFQFEGRATRLVNREVAPDSFFEAVDVNGLSRPGPLFSGATAEYIDVKRGKRDAASIHPVVDAITSPTRGQVIYQEQVLKILADFGGLPVAKVHDIRKIISQKLGEAQFNASSKAFVEGAVRLHGVDEDTAMRAWGTCVTSATYAFVYAHSASYALIGWWCMWLKIHYPAAFYASQLRKMEPDKWPRLIKDALNHKVDVRWIDPANSQEAWSVVDGAVLAGWLQVPGVGDVLAKRILDYHPQSFEELCGVRGIGPKIIEKLNAIDPQDPFGLHRVERALREVRSAIYEGEVPLRPATHTSDEVLDAPGDSTLVWVGFVKLKEYKDAIEDERARSGDDMETIMARLRDPHLTTGCVLHCYDDGDEDVYVRVDRRVYPKFKRRLEGIQPGYHVIHVVARKSKNTFGASLYVKELTVIDPE
jgi:DNA polymerase-3 subunit alpha